MYNVSPCPHSHVSTAMSPQPCLHNHVSTAMSPQPCLHSHVSTAMSPQPCLYSHVSTAMSPQPCLHSRSQSLVNPGPDLHSTFTRIVIELGTVPPVSVMCTCAEVRYHGNVVYKRSETVSCQTESKPSYQLSERKV